MAVRDIQEGEELLYDYGVREEEWMKTRARDTCWPEPQVPEDTLEQALLHLSARSF